jgi:hypothetical protein
MPVVFFTTAGDFGPVPANADEIVELARTRTADYWNDPNGSGFAVLSFCADGREAGTTSQLTFTKSDRHGFHFWFQYPVKDRGSPHYRKPSSFHSCSDPDLKEWVAVRDSHEGSRPIFTGLFVPPDAAAEVIREFLSSGGMSDRVQWVTGTIVQAAKQAHGLG